MFEDLSATTKMPAISTRSTGGETSLSGLGLRDRWRSFRRSLHEAVRSSGAWFLAICVGALAASVQWVSWVMSAVASAAVALAETFGRGIQETLPQENQGLWLTLAQMHAGWFIGVPVGFWFLVIVFKEVK